MMGVGEEVDEGFGFTWLGNRAPPSTATNLLKGKVSDALTTLGSENVRKIAAAKK
jgi:hypothetical protein